ncbi:MAG TPA: hypothetical protein PKA13_00425 [Geminicoccaceae bacterium]|nr:hypothetical protein [Geminicoccus sp.]HMU48203.1 hypothetical protein [Geminicoccaceae bacterium]
MALVLLLLASGMAAAQTSPPDLRRDARAMRLQRDIEGRSLTQPGAAAIDAMNARRTVVRGRPGGLTPTERRVERSLDVLSTPLPQPRASGGPSPVPRQRLPASNEDDLFMPGSLTSSVAEGLLDRADDGLADGRLDQARSDLALAEQQIDGLDPAEAVALRERAVALRSRLKAR